MGPRVEAAEDGAKARLEVHGRTNYKLSKTIVHKIFIIDFGPPGVECNVANEIPGEGKTVVMKIGNDAEKKGGHGRVESRIRIWC